MTELARLRVRAHVPASPGSPAAPRRPAWHPHPGDPALVVHVLADEYDRPALATAREVVLTADAAVTISERLYAPGPAAADLRATLANTRPDVPAGLGAGPVEVADLENLGRLVTNRSYRQRWPLVGTDLPWALGRLAAHAGPARGGADGFSIALAGTGIVGDDGRWRGSFHYPRLIATPDGVGQAGAHLRWGSVADPAARARVRRRASFLDLLTLAGALAGGDFEEPVGAARLFDVGWPTGIADPLERLRAEAAALVALYGRLVHALAEVAPGLHPADAYSFGSIATQVLRTGNVHPPLAKADRVPVADLGAAASASFGGWFDCRLPGVVLPMVLVDVSKTYASIFRLLDLTWVYAARSFRSVERDPAGLWELLADVAAGGDGVRDPASWAAWGMTFVTLRPRGEELPVQVEACTGNWRTAVAPLDLSGGTATYGWADVAAAVLAGADPAGVDLVRVFQLLPAGTQPHLHPLRLPTGRLVDLIGVNLGAAMAQEASRADLPRWQAGLAKAVGNALAFGGLARADRGSLPRPVAAAAIGPAGEQLLVRTRHPEAPGPHAFLPASAAVCAGARLLIRLAHRAVADAGSAVVAMHADSLAIPCQAEGGWADVPGSSNGRLRVLSVDELAGLLDRFAPLGIRFKCEVPPEVDGQSVYGLAVGVNRVVFAAGDGRGGWQVVRSSDAGLGGHLADPSDNPGAREADGRWSWASAVESVLFAAAAAGEADPARPLSALGDPEALPDWAHRPVVRRYVVTRWSALARLREETGEAAVMPFTRYLRADSGRPGGPVTLGGWPDARGWTGADWRLGSTPVGLDGLGGPGLCKLTGPARPQRIVVRSVAEYFAGWLQVSDPLANGPLRGLRGPTRVHSAPGLVGVVGKDGAELLSADRDPALPASESRLTYGSAADDSLRERARAVGLRALARRSGLPRVTVADWAAGGETSPERLAVIVGTLEVIEAGPVPVPGRCLLCGMPTERQWCSERCRAIARRAAARAAPPDFPACPACRRRFLNLAALVAHPCAGPA